MTGPESLTQARQVETIGEMIGRPLRIEEISPEEARRELLAVIPAAPLHMLLDALAGGLGHAVFMTSTVAEITGTPARTFRESAADHAAEFRGDTHSFQRLAGKISGSASLSTRKGFSRT